MGDLDAPGRGQKDDDKSADDDMKWNKQKDDDVVSAVLGECHRCFAGMYQPLAGQHSCLDCRLGRQLRNLTPESYLICSSFPLLQASMHQPERRTNARDVLVAITLDVGQSCAPLAPSGGIPLARRLL